MNVVVHTDNSISSEQSSTAGVASEVERMLARYDDRVVRVQVHLSDESGGRFTHTDIRCVMEAFTEGQSPAVATEHADTVDAAVRGTGHRLERVLEARLGRPSNNVARRRVGMPEPGAGVSGRGAQRG